MRKFYLLLCVSLFLSAHSRSAEAAETPKPSKDGAVMNTNLNPARKDYQEYVDFFEKVYDTMDKNYYYPLNRKRFLLFVQNFDKKIYSQLKNEGKSVDYIRWRSAAYLVDALKSEDDVFSAFMPPKFAEKFEKEVLGQKIDLGIEGELVSDGYLVKKIEPRSDAFEKGLRENDLIVKIDDTDVLTLKPEQIVDRLTPLENTKVALQYRDSVQKELRVLEAISKEYFKQTVFMVPVDVPGVDCLQIQRFNRMTGEDMSRFLDVVRKRGTNKLIIDLRGNPGGPPLAAREISAFFLKPEEEFASFRWKNKPPGTLDVPKIPEEFQYKGDIVILVDHESGSASELFSGIMQFRGRATVMGKNTAGQVFLKSMFNFDDQSMLLLVTARGHKPDGSVFSFSGVEPNVSVETQADALIHEAAEYLVSQPREKAPKS